MMPQEARLRNFTYASNTTIDLNIQYQIRDMNNEVRTIDRVIPKIKLCNFPVMLKSSICILNQYSNVSENLTGECPMDCGGYFIIKGSEKTVLGQERAAENRIYVFNGKNTPKWSWVAEFKSVPDNKCISPKQVEMMVSSKANVYGHGIYVIIPRLKQKRQIELFTLFRALGVLSDKQICEYILLNTEEKKHAEMLKFLEASIDDASPYIKNKDTIQENALEHIISMVSYNHHTNTTIAATTADTEAFAKTNARKKREYTLEIFKNDFFPHCKSLPQKLYLLGLMVLTKLICLEQIF
jgi:DNA-directed RNA polymerase II subunit RPB2